MNGKLFIKLFFFFFMLHAFEAFAQEKDTTEKKKDTIKTSRSLRRLLLKDSDRISRKYKYNAAFIIGKTKCTFFQNEKYIF